MDDRQVRCAEDAQRRGELTLAEAIAREFSIPAVYDDAEALLREVRPDFVDNITEIGGHKPRGVLSTTLRTPQGRCIMEALSGEQRAWLARETGGRFVVPIPQVRVLD